MQANRLALLTLTPLNEPPNSRVYICLQLITPKTQAQRILLFQSFIYTRRKSKPPYIHPYLHLPSPSAIQTTTIMTSSTPPDKGPTLRLITEDSEERCRRVSSLFPLAAPELIQETAQLFKRSADTLCSDGTPTTSLCSLWWVPGRVEVAGKHTDYCGGE